MGNESVTVSVTKRTVWSRIAVTVRNGVSIDTVTGPGSVTNDRTSDKGEPMIPTDLLIPTLTARREGRYLVVFCPHCRGNHYHAVVAGSPIGSGDGHHMAHCHHTTPFKETGYNVREVAP